MAKKHGDIQGSGQECPCSLLVLLAANHGDIEGFVAFPVGVVEVPPFAGVDGEAVAGHGVLEELAVAVDFFRYFWVGCGGFFGEVVVGGGHGEFAALGIDEGDIDGGAAVVAAAFCGIGDVAVIGEDFPHGALDGEGAVGVPDFEGEVLLFEIGLNAGEFFGGGAVQEGE